jgi:hypothetical protein
MIKGKASQFFLTDGQRILGSINNLIEISIFFVS